MRPARSFRPRVYSAHALVLATVAGYIVGEKGKRSGSGEREADRYSSCLVLARRELDVRICVNFVELTYGIGMCCGCSRANVGVFCHLVLELESFL